MTNKIALISDDSNFFEYLKSKPELRKSDKLYTFSFEEIPTNFDFLENSIIIVDSENAKSKTLELLSLFEETPVIVMAYNEDNVFKNKCYRAGMFDYMSILITDSEFRARILSAFKVASIIEKKSQYKSFLVQNKILADGKDIYTDYKNTIKLLLQDLKTSSRAGVLLALSPNEKEKFIVNPSLLETVILKNIRRNDVLINYIPNKYFLFLYDIDYKMAEKLWIKIKQELSINIYAGIVEVKNQTAQQLINASLKELFRAINNDAKINIQNGENLKNNNMSNEAYQNFKLYRKKSEQQIENIISPVFYHIQQKYSEILTGVTIEQDLKEGCGYFNLKGKHFSGEFCLTSPGFSKINIDISMQKNSEPEDTKRITLNRDELESGILEDLLEQFIQEIKNKY
ncbi:hypothetical protein IJO12_07600 [bacterium]|nr:hypothetical protein [bacterium]